MLSALAHSMLRDHVHLWITFVFCSNTCVSLNITKTFPQHHATLSAFHAFAVHDLYSLSIARTCTIARMSPFSGQCERLSRRLVLLHSLKVLTSKFHSKHVKKANYFRFFRKILSKLCWGHVPCGDVIFFKS